MELNITKFIKKETNLKDGNKSQKFTERELNVLIYKALNEQLILSGVVEPKGTCCLNLKKVGKVNDMFESWDECEKCGKEIV
tara:strand:+ start:3087 stop:3332 length:246 start_codon:yes stop_codon:yes gene_type:complete